jgi:ABC-2 type transport system permease protein
MTEMRRLSNRQAIHFIVLILMILVVGLCAALWVSINPPSDADLQTQEQAFAAAQSDWDANGMEMMEACVNEEAQLQAIDPTIDKNCEEIQPPVRDDYVWAAPSWDDLLTGHGLGGVGFLSGFAPWLAGAMAILMAALFVGDEFSSGSLSAWLTIEPRRTRVYVTKLVVCGIGAAVLILLADFMTTIGTWLILKINGQPTGVPAGYWTDVYIDQLVGGLFIVVLGAIAGAALTFIVRNSMAIIVAVVGYIVIVEMIVARIIPSLQQVLLSDNTLAYVAGSSDYTTQSCATAETGLYLCSEVVHTVSRTWATSELGILAVVAIIAGWIFFLRGEVK